MILKAIRVGSREVSFESILHNSLELIKALEPGQFKTLSLKDYNGLYSTNIIINSVCFKFFGIGLNSIIIGLDKYNYESPVKLDFVDEQDNWINIEGKARATLMAYDNELEPSGSFIESNNYRIVPIKEFENLICYIRNASVNMLVYQVPVI